jgi:hypothetical protein
MQASIQPDLGWLNRFVISASNNAVVTASPRIQAEIQLA